MSKLAELLKHPWGNVIRLIVFGVGAWGTWPFLHLVLVIGCKLTRFPSPALSVEVFRALSAQLIVSAGVVVTVLTLALRMARPADDESSPPSLMVGLGVIVIGAVLSIASMMSTSGDKENPTSLGEFGEDCNLGCKARTNAYHHKFDAGSSPDSR